MLSLPSKQSAFLKHCQFVLRQWLERTVIKESWDELCFSRVAQDFQPDFRTERSTFCLVPGQRLSGCEEQSLLPDM